MEIDHKAIIMLSDDDTLDDVLNDVNLDVDDTETVQDDGDDLIPGTEAQLKQRLKAAIMYSVKQICENEVLWLGECWCGVCNPTMAQWIIIFIAHLNRAGIVCT